jgi:hypothetical protein
MEQQRAKKLAEQAERQRILRLLENDKVERQVRERERRESIISMPPETPRAVSAEPIGGADLVALSFRLTDGSNVKSRFPPSATLGADVRAWIEQVQELPPSLLPLPKLSGRATTEPHRWRPPIQLYGDPGPLQ